ncbi:hypothetical protein DYB31_010919 [Aphanomyces astaci]|uniref:Uncharacterized protein n=1 Tax=Aphanomyces astaci TaxID=112090 RepID=A0A397FG85_APHAT|nr:hypothetical protein DYB31_010919 [Aphanomyces astaci]
MLTLCRDVVENDAILREILRSQPCSAPNALFHRANLMEKAEQFVSAFPGVAATKETEQVLWKPCFYKRIEDFRRRIRKVPFRFHRAPSQSGTDRSIRDHFFKLSGEFQAFLDEAAAYYERLHGYFASSSSSSSTAAALQHSMFRCLIFLGDIARYRELHSHKAKKHFAVAEGFYHRALAILPDNGNPHNQLAVLATYVEAEAIAVYRYCRSLLLPTPFATAEENLVLLFERNRHRALPPAADGGKTITASSLPKDKSAYLKQFLHRLTRLHGLLVAPPPSPPDQHALDSSIVCDALTSLLAAGVLGDALVLKLFAVNMFCICRSNLQSHAISLTLAMAALVLPFVHDKPLLLGPVSVLCDFFRAHPHYLTVTPLEETTSPLWAWTQALADALNRRQEATPYIKVPDAAAVAAAKPHLKESIEVQFFQPLGVEYAFGRRSPAEVADVDATSIRWANVYWFAHATMVPQETWRLGDSSHLNRVVMRV